MFSPACLQELAGLVLEKSPGLFLHAEEAVRADKPLVNRVLTAQPAMGQYVAKALLADPDVARLVRVQ
jgi:hypothetical protein